VPFQPTLTEKPDAAELRTHLRAAADYVIDLQAKPHDQRGDGFAEDVRSGIDFLQTFDPIERVVSEAEAREAQAEADKRAREAAERAERAGLRGPSASFAGDAEQPRSPGAEVVLADGYEDFAKRGGHGMFEVEVRALLTTGDDDAIGSGAGIWRPVGTPTLNASAIRARRLFVRDLLSTGQTGLSSIPYIRELNAATNETGAAMTSEGSAKAEVTMEFTPADAPVRKITAWLAATTELLADAPTLRSYIDNRLTYMVLLREELQVLKGNGTAPNLEGVMIVTGHQTQTAVAGDVPATFAAAYGKIENVDGDPDGVAMNPLDFWGAISTRHATQFDNGFGGNAPADVVQGSLSWGERVVRTRSLDAGEAVAASWAMGATLLTRSGVSIRVGDQHAEYFIENKVAVLAEERVALPIWRPDFFVDVDIDLTA
jgi:HK97 family phage major capsid protein